MNLKITVSAVAAVALLVALGASLRQCSEPPPVRTQEKAKIQYILDTVALGAYKARVAKLTGDSLRLEAVLRAAARRASLKLYKPDGTFARDTKDSSKPAREVCLEETDLRVLLVADTTCPVRLDSAHVALAEKDEVIAEIREGQPSKVWKPVALVAAATAAILTLLLSIKSGGIF